MTNKLPSKERVFSLPSSEELEKIEKLAQGSTEKIITAWLNFESNKTLDASNTARDIRNYRRNAILAGTLLATIGFAVEVFAIYTKADLYGVAALVAPIATLAGVFIWGFRPKE